MWKRLLESTSKENKMHSLISHLIMIFHIGGVLSTIKCPLNETEWQARSKTKVCQGSDVYHCLLVEDGKTRKENCIGKTLIMDGHCPIFTRDDNLHWQTCNRTGCPTTHFKSDEVYKYPICFGDIESEENKFHENQTLSGENALPLKIGIPVGIIAVVSLLVIVVIVVTKNRQQTLPCHSGNEGDGNGDSELVQLIEEPEYIRVGLDQLKANNILYVIGELGNAVSTAGKKITKKYAERHKMKYEYHNYLDVSKRFSELRPEKVFKLGFVNFIDGWGGLWNENPCERRETLDTMFKVFKQSKNIEKRKFVIGLRTDIQEHLKDELEELGIEIKESNRCLLDNSSIYKRRQIEEEIAVLQNSCSNDNCDCKNLNFDQVAEINQVRIGIYLVVKLMSLDHAMIRDFLKKEVGPLEAMCNHFEGLMEGEQIWPWLPYFVCLGYYDKDEFRQDIADGFNISQSMISRCERIDKYTKPPPNLVPLWSTRFSCNPLVKEEDKNLENVIVFWHNFLYICAFHACYKKYPKQIMRFCNLDAILQLVRPKGHTDPLIIEADDKEIDIFCEERLKEFCKRQPFLEHPLVQYWNNRKK